LDYRFVQRLHAAVALTLALVLAVANDYPTLDGSSHGSGTASEEEEEARRRRRWLYWTYYSALALLLVRELQRERQ
jgi:hypothetical protein